MAHDNARAVSQPVLEPETPDFALPAPRPPVLEPAGHDISQPAPRPVHGSRAGWILSTVVAAAAAWAAGWLAGVSWAWHEMTPRYLRRSHRRPGAGLPGSL